MALLSFLMHLSVPLCEYWLLARSWSTQSAFRGRFPTVLIAVGRSRFHRLRKVFEAAYRRCLSIQWKNTPLYWPFVLGIHRSPVPSRLAGFSKKDDNSPVTGEFPAQRASNAENVSIWGRHHVPFTPRFMPGILPQSSNHCGSVKKCTSFRNKSWRNGQSHWPM